MDSPYTPRQTHNDNKKGKIINDPVHGHMEFESDIVKAIDTVYFQRLRELKQLGSADWVFPGAVHSRFIHSLGVSYLANKVIKRLQHRQPELGIQDRDILLISLAGLCHDLGHGPFSHGFERVVQIVLEEEAQKGNQDVPRNWHHENASEMLFEQVVKEGGLGLREQEVELVKAMIRGVNKKESRPMDKPLFYFQIVANKQTGMDVDKYDYLLRDAMFCGARIAFDITRLLRPQVRRDADGDMILSYYIKEEWMIHQLFRSRFDLHHQVYGHSVVVALQLMIEEVLVLAKDWLRITQAIKCPKLYLHLTDNVIPRIECLKQNEVNRGFPPENLKKAQELIRRIKKRDLYTSILHDVNMGVEMVRKKEDRIHAEGKLKEQLVAAQPALREYKDDFMVVVGDRDFTQKAENPLKLVPFYTNKDPSLQDMKYLTDNDLKHSSQPAHFWERIIRVYCKDKSLSGVITPLVVEAFKQLPASEQAGGLSPVAPRKVTDSPNASQEQTYLFGNSSQGKSGSGLGLAKRSLFSDVFDEEPVIKRPKFA